MYYFGLLGISLGLYCGWQLYGSNPVWLWVVGMMVGVTAALWVMSLAYWRDDRLAKASAVLGELEAGTSSLLRTIYSSHKSLVAIEEKALATVSEVDSIQSRVHDCLDLAMEKRKDDAVAVIDEAFGSFESELSRHGLSFIWNSLPYSSMFGEFSTREKALYFDAITTGNWSKLNAHFKQRRG